jgi:gamma-glutamylcyclotransferase (GGCT)/AIG2-like uncharacterized protein YtfP
MHFRPLLFVYGTLKPGFENHRRYCAGSEHAGPAWAEGRLYPLPQGYPALVVPRRELILLGTGDYDADAGNQQRLLEDCRASLRSESAPQPERLDRASGELLELADAQEFAELDLLEDFRPGTASSYLRALIWVENVSGERLPAWSYVWPGEVPPDGEPLPHNRWP